MVLCFPDVLERQFLGARCLHRRPLHRRVFPSEEGLPVSTEARHRSLRNTSRRLGRQASSHLLDNGHEKRKIRLGDLDVPARVRECACMLVCVCMYICVLRMDVIVNVKQSC